MCIGIIYDAHTGDSWHRIEDSVYSVKVALKDVRLPLPIACIFDTLKDNLVELDVGYRQYRPELLYKARSILHRYLREKQN
jgi:hypothetical protein